MMNRYRIHHRKRLKGMETAYQIPITHWNRLQKTQDMQRKMQGLCCDSNLERLTRDTCDIKKNIVRNKITYISVYTYI